MLESQYWNVIGRPSLPSTYFSLATHPSHVTIQQYQTTAVLPKRSAHTCLQDFAHLILEHSPCST